jgi:hypothetical protein
MAAVKLANPFSGITEESLREEFESPTLDLSHWKRMKCGIAARGTGQAITDGEWDAAQTTEEIPEGRADHRRRRLRVEVGHDGDRAAP